MATTILRTNRTRVLWRIALATLIALAAIAVLLFVDSSRLPPRSEPWGRNFRLVCAAAMAGLWLLETPGLVCLVVNDRAIVLDDGGLLDRTAGLGLIPWRRIEAVALVRFGGADSVELRIRDLDGFLSQLSFIRRGIVKLGLKQGLNGPRLRTAFVSTSPAEVKRLIEERVEGAA